MRNDVAQTCTSLEGDEVTLSLIGMELELELELECVERYDKCHSGCVFASCKQMTTIDSFEKFW